MLFYVLISSCETSAWARLRCIYFAGLVDLTELITVAATVVA